MIAFNQVVWIVGGLFLWLIAGALVAGHLYARRNYFPCQGEIVALRTGTETIQRDTTPLFYPIVSYTDRFGQVKEAETNSGSSDLAGKIPGKKVKVLVRPDNDRIAQIDGPGMLVWAFIVFLFGAVPMGIGLTQFPTNIYTLGMIGLFILWSAFKFSKHIIPERERGTVNEFRMRKAKEFLEGREKIRRIDRAEALNMMAQLDRRFLKYLWITCLVLPVFGGVGGYLIYDSTRFVRYGVQVEGTVVGQERSTSSDDVLYYSVIEYQTADGKTLRNKGRIATNHPKRVGDKVTLRYMPSAPDHILDGPEYVPLAIGGAIISMTVLGFFGAICSGFRARARLRGKTA